MGTITSMEPILVPKYVTASTLTMRLASVLFHEAMAAAALADPDDLNYQAWWNLHQAAEKFSMGEIEMNAEERERFDASLLQAHRAAHPCVDPLALANCLCVAHEDIRSLLVILPWPPSRAMVRALGVPNV